MMHNRKLIGLIAISMGVIFAGEDDYQGADLSRSFLVDFLAANQDKEATQSDQNFKDSIKYRKKLYMSEWTDIDTDDENCSLRINDHASLELRKKEVRLSLLGKQRVKYNITKLIHCSTDRGPMSNALNEILLKLHLFDVTNHVDYYAFSEDKKNIAALVNQASIVVIPIEKFTQHWNFDLDQYYEAEDYGYEKINTWSDALDARIQEYCTSIAYGMTRKMNAYFPVDTDQGGIARKLIAHITINNNGSMVAFCNNHQVFIGTKERLKCVYEAPKHKANFKKVMKSPFYFADYIAFNEDGTKLGVLVSAMYDACPEKTDFTIFSANEWNKVFIRNVCKNHKDVLFDEEKAKIHELLEEKILSPEKVGKVFKTLYEDERIQRRVIVISLDGIKADS